MEANSGNKTYSNFYKSFTSFYEDKPDQTIAYAFRSATSPDNIGPTPILPGSDREDIESEPEYDTLCFDLTQEKEIPVVLCPPTSGGEALG